MASRHGKGYDITGRRFGRLTALRDDGPGPCWQVRWICRCDCGNIVKVYKNNLLSGHTTSCGCLRDEKARKLIQRINENKPTMGHAAGD